MAEERVFLGATVGPLAAAIIHREMGGDLRRRLFQLRALGEVESARQLALALAQLRAAAAQLERNQQSADEGGASNEGHSPLDGGFGGSGTGGWLSTADVATRLEVSERQVRHLEASGRLRGQRVSRRWLFDPVSVAEEQARRAGASTASG